MPSYVEKKNRTQLIENFQISVPLNPIINNRAIKKIAAILLDLQKLITFECLNEAKYGHTSELNVKLFKIK